MSTAAERRVIIHCDDIGMCHAANLAMKEFLTSSPVRTGSVMIPCPWAYDFLRWLNQWSAGERTADIGIHLTLTSEWATYRWRPLLPPASVSGLFDPEGFLWRDVVSVATHASPEEVHQELSAQVEQAKAWGFSPTHLDTHMGTVFATPAFLGAYLVVAAEHQVTPMLIRVTPRSREEYARAGLPVDALAPLIEDYPGPKLDHLVQVPPLPRLRVQEGDHTPDSGGTSPRPEPGYHPPLGRHTRTAGHLFRLATAGLGLPGLPRPRNLPDDG